jgi:thioredoxin reductase (NADPH)
MTTGAPGAVKPYMRLPAPRAGRPEALVDSYDAIVVGAGPAGLTAASYLGRFRRRVLVLDGGRPRAAWIPTSHNTPGFPDGVGGPELLSRLRDQAERYGARIEAGRAGALSSGKGVFEVAFDGKAARAPFVLMATGVVDIKPALAGIEEAILKSVVRVCPICDAYEAIDKAIAVIGDGALGVREALFLRTYSPRVTLLHTGDSELGGEGEGLARAGVEVLRIAVSDITLGDVELTVAGARPRTFDHLYLALGCELESRLAIAWGARHDGVGKLIVDAHQQTSIDGLYAAGDVVLGLNQIAVAAAEAAIAATDIHNRLRG